MNTNSRIIHGILANGFGQIVTILIQITGVPLFLYFWGAEKYGEWLILSTIPAYLSMSDFGFANVASNDMIASVAKGEYEKVIKIFQSILVVILLAAVVSGLVVAVIIFLQMTHELLPIKNIGKHEIAIVLIVQWLQVVVGQICGQISAGYRCDGNFAISTVYGNILRLGEFLISILALLVGGGFIEIVLCVLAIRVLGTIAMAIGMKRRSLWLTMGISKSSWLEIRRLLWPSLAFMTFPLGNAISLQGFTLVVGTLMGGSAVTLFSTYRTLTRIPLQMMSMINSSVWPELSRAFGLGNIEQMRKLHRLSVGWAFWSTLIILTSLFFVGEPLLKYWTHGEVPFQQKLLMMLELVIFINAFWLTSSIIAMSTNRHEKMAVMYMLGNILALGISFPLGIQYGLLGIAGSLLIIDVMMITLVLRQSMAMTNDKLLHVIYSIFVFPVKLLKIAKTKITLSKSFV